MMQDVVGGDLLERLPSSRGCFVCGSENPIGLHVHFDKTAEGVQTTVRPGRHFEGFDGVLQGGVVAGLMDDAMWYAIFGHSAAITMTAELTVRYKAPIPVETDLAVTGRVTDQRRSLYTCAAAITGPDGTVLAEAAGKFMLAPRSLTDRLKEQMG
jgi:acyl-coenzyme A thioesterase PaaI-like protein